VIHDGHQAQRDRRSAGVSELAHGPRAKTAPRTLRLWLLWRHLMTWLMHGEAPLTVTAVVNHDKPEIYRNVDATPRSCLRIRAPRP